MPDCGPRLSGAVQGFTELDCNMATDFSFFMISKIPNAATIAKICTTSSCMETMEAIRSAVPDECSIRPYGYNLYADILNPIETACAKMPATTTPSPTKESFTEDSSSTSSPSTTSFRPSTWTPTLTPQSSSSYGYTSTSSSSDDGLDTFTVIAIIFGCVFAFAILYAIFRSCSQSNKRDPTVQVNQNLSYGNVGDFDTIATPAYTEMKSSGEARRSVTLNKTGGAVYKTVDPSAPTATSTGLAASTVNLSTAPDLIPLMEDEIITAARIPMDKITRGQRLSGGGYGEVFHGKYKDEVVAIKTLLPQHRNDVRRIKSFLKEVKLMATLEHERIVTFVGVGWDSVSDICVLSEFMDGGDLRSVLARFDAQHDAIGFDQNKVKIALHMAHALTYMHSLQSVVLHRDLKSSNVLLNKNMDAKITDFGISRERAESTMTRGVGTSLWMAPEVMMGGRYDEKADMFSFGVVLSELDTNKLPYATQVDLDAAKTNYVELMQSVARGRLTVEFSYESHPDIVALGRDCVAVNPAERPSAGQALHRVHQVWRQYQ